MEMFIFNIHSLNKLIFLAKSIIKNQNCIIHVKRPRSRWEDNIRMDLKEITINTRSWFDLAQYIYYWRALVNVALNLWVP